ncbi:hypothetical protein SCOR_24990 [Sulfidibacter corallicola]|uniref:ABM domain-containing protein n=1 Tax=Sulfidibacter corallicola TaxID=2818388 RepID=A0A8A4TTC1_SULCO|nr:hypothetical protein [Sulfidibacter corallicola]QTD52338.1 hypothetical protein J3U87_07670 [Sulfidibacter corallicola]
MLIEMVRYALSPGVAPEEHRQAALETHETAISQLPGFRDRILCPPGIHEEWIDLVIWEDRHAFEHASKSVHTDPKLAKWMGQINESSVVMQVGEVRCVHGTEPPALKHAGCWLGVCWKTLPDVDQDAHLALDKEVHRDIMAKIDGYLGAYTAKDEKSGTWFELVAWRDQAAAHAGSEKAVVDCLAHPVYKRHMEECDEASVSMTFIEPKVVMPVVTKTG